MRFSNIDFSLTTLMVEKMYEDIFGGYTAAMDKLKTIIYCHGKEDIEY